MPSMGVAERTWSDADGIEVFYRWWEPEGKAVGAVAIVHGASEHSGRYHRFARALNARGYAVAALDQRGHGRTAVGTGPGQLGPRGMDGALDDVGDLVAIAASGGIPVFLFGHSMGAIVAHAFVAKRSTSALSGLVLSGSVGTADTPPEAIEGLEAAVAGGMGSEPLDILGANNSAFEPARTRYDWLSRDPAEVDTYIADPLCGDDLPLTFGFVLELVRTVAELATPPAFEAIRADLPIMLITGERDPVSAQAEQVRELEARLRTSAHKVDAYYYPEARHELLNEVNRDEVTSDVLAWLDAQRAARTA